MDVIDGAWISQRLGGQRGEKVALAAAMGVRPDQLSKILKGERAVQAHEIPAILRFFDRREGLAEDAARFDAAPVKRPTPALDQVMQLLAPGVRRPAPWRVTTSSAAGALQAGDILVVELGLTAKPGDLVLATIRSGPEGEFHTIIRRYFPPLIVPIESDDRSPAHPAEGSFDAAVVGTICAVLRVGPHADVFSTKEAPDED